MKNYGYQNERDFVKLFNKKHLNELDANSQLFLKELFGENIKDRYLICVRWNFIREMIEEYRSAKI